MLNMDLSEIREQIQVYPENWINIYTTNCYAYALGLDIPEYKICKGAYQPGTISMDNNPLMFEKYFDYNTLTENLEKDLKTLGIYYKEVPPEYNVKTDEWKIALFIDSYYGEKIIDFHFLRQKSNANWFHKNGFKGVPRERDYLGKIITDPINCRLDPYKYKKCLCFNIRKKIEVII